MGLGLAALVRPADINVSHARDLAGETDVGALEATANEMPGAAFAAGVRGASTLVATPTVPININGDGERVRREDLTRLSLDSDSVDAVPSLDTFEHIVDYERALAELRVLKPSGVAIMHVPCYFFD
jgi:hypothetical protein